MKKLISAAFSLLTVLSLTSCGKDKTEAPADTLSNIKNTDRFVYSDTAMTNFVYELFAADSENMLYISRNYANDGKINIEIFSADGSKTDEITVDTGSIEDLSEALPNPVGMDICGGNIYILCSVSDGYKIYSCGTDGSDLHCVYESPELIYAEKMEAVSDGIYILGVPQTGSEQINKKYTDENGNDIYFEYGSKSLLFIDKSGNVTVTETKYPITFTSSDDGRLIVYSFDEEGGYYFIESNNGCYSEKKYNNSYGMLNDIDLAGNGNDIIISGFSNQKLCAGSADGGAGVSDILENVFVYLPEDVKCAGGNIYFKTGDNFFAETEMIYRIESGNINKKGRINIVSSQFVPNMPFSGGYEINSEQLSSDMFSVKVLSLSDSFDISCFSSEAVYAENMKSSAAFYPMNSISGVSEYLDKCFPYLKEACTDENGEIWALPISLDIPVIVYNKANCENADFNFSDKMTVNEFADQVYSAYDKNVRYDCMRYRFVENMLAQYLQNNSSFDTDTFRELAAFLKEKCNTEIFKYDPMIYSDMMTYGVNKRLGTENLYDHSEYDSICFTLLPSSEEQTEYISDNGGISAAPLPKISPDAPNCASCMFLCINPGAENIENAKGYISSLISVLSSKPDNVMFSSGGDSDDEYRKALRKIYSEGQIYFNVPSQIYYNDFENYCSGSISLDEFIHDADEKLRLYVWEKE